MKTIITTEIETAIREYDGMWWETGNANRYQDVDPTADQAVVAAREYHFAESDLEDVDFVCRVAWQNAADDLVTELEARELADADAAMFAKFEARDELISLVERSLGMSLRISAGGSAYGHYERGGVCLEIRVSDHAQKSGGGFCEFRGERMGESDLQFVSTDEWTRETIRAALAAAIRTAREEC